MYDRSVKGAVSGLFVLLLCCTSVAWAVDSSKIHALKGSSWWTEVQRNLREEEYRVTWLEGAGALHAVNPAANLRAFFRASGVELIPRTGNADWRGGFELTSFGREGLVETPGDVDPRAEGRRVEYRYGGITEWYVNRDEGIEQGFVVHERPKGDGGLIVESRLTGDLEVRLDSDGRTAVFLQAGEEVLSYGKLVVKDADGKVLSSRLALDGNRLSIVVEDDGRYPIVIDPLLTTPSWIAESDKASMFGYSVSNAGDVNGDGYDDVVVGAPFYDNDQENEGRAFVYHGSATGLSTTPAWIAETNQAEAQFGRAVSCAGDVNGDSYDDVIVGATWYNYGHIGEGRAFVYHGSAGGLSTTPAWTGESNQTYSHFGNSVSSAGDVNGDGYDDVIVGAYWYNNGQADEGRAYVYHGSATGLSATPAWTAESDQALAIFGNSVSTAGDVNGDGYDDVIVGANDYDYGETDEGRAFVYLGSAAGLSATPAWTAESNQASADFGVSVSDAGDVNGDSYGDVIVGAMYYDNGQFDEGRAFVYYGSATGLSNTPGWATESNQLNAGLGRSVSSAGDVNGDFHDDVIVGALYYDNGQNEEGRAYVFHGSATGLSTAPAWIAESNQQDAYFGGSVSGAGDVNGDSYDDVIVGAYLYQGLTGGGAAFVYHGSPDPACSVEPTSLDMGAVLVGNSRDTTFTITNTGGGTLAGSVGESCSHFNIVSGGGAYSLGAGQSLVVTVRFEPTSSGTHTCTAETGTGLCNDVDLIGQGDQVVPVMVQHYGSCWRGDRVEVTWVLRELHSPVTFEIMRREENHGDYVLISGPEIIQRDKEFVFMDPSVEPERTYGYRVGITEDGLEIASFEISLSIPALMLALEQNHPNPFNPSTEIAFTLDREQQVRLVIYDVAGRAVRTVVNRRLPAGRHTEEWDGRDGNGCEMASGVYFVRLTGGNRTLTRKGVLIR